ncbi:toll/interleukin-1 receptor domain-containing protein [Bradyrhizobium sp. DASA03076]|uniref:toll/interleukin-1 receptor domain-containing protein n=1 Tax=Bradyrhizobium sp. BLXBL-03 TaxID=3395916 RepID=UPI003F703708
MASLFFSYSHADEVLRDQLERQLSLLKRQGVIEVWHDRRIDAGQDFAAEIDRHIETDDIILLLVSSDFLASDYCYDIEMKRAMDRHDAGEAIVIPVILRACDWRGAPFGKLNATPPDGKPITQYPDRDQALLEVAKAVRAAANRVEPPHLTREPLRPSSQARRASTPRSSNLRLAKEFTDRDRDRFKHESFEYIAKFFENSLDELERRNPGIETGFRRVDANRFTAAVYKNGRAISRCTVFIGGIGADGIAYLASESTESNAMNESLSIRSDEHDLYLTSLGMQRGTGSHLSQEGAAEYYWSMLIERLQGN